MSYIPDCRKGNDGLYNEKYINKENKEFVRGFDYALETILNMFSNLETYTNEFLDADFNIRKVNDGAVSKQYDDCLNKDEKAEETFTKEDFNKANQQTQLVTTLMYCIADWHEMERNQLLVSMIDGTPTDILEKNKAEYEEQQKAIENAQNGENTAE